MGSWWRTRSDRAAYREPPTNSRLRRNRWPPRWTDEGFYPLDVLPAEDRFVPGQDALIWSQRGNERFAYVGLLRNVRCDVGGLRFDKFERLRRPVVLVDGEVNNTPAYYDGTKGFMNDFSYIPEDSFQRALDNADRPARD